MPFRRAVMLVFVVANALVASAQIPKKGDVNGDGRADVILQESAIWQGTANSGRIAEWQMNGFAISGAIVANPGNGWLALDVADFDGNGKADIVFEHNTTRDVAIWLMDGNTIATAAFVGSPGPAWRVQCAGDINGDGKADIVLQNYDNGEIAYWQINGTTLVAGHVLGYGGKLPGAELPQWRPNVVGDFNGDGFGDLLLIERNQNPGGGTDRSAVWLTNGTAVTAGNIVSYGYLSAAGSADFNGDNRDDIVVDNGQAVWVWLMNGFAITAALVAGNDAWDVTTIGDYDGDGNTDILLQSGGAFAEWKLNGTTFVASQIIANNGGSITRWWAAGFPRRL